MQLGGTQTNTMKSTLITLTTFLLCLMSASAQKTVSEEFNLNELRQAFSRVDVLVGEPAPSKKAAIRILDDLPYDDRLFPFYHGVASGDPSQEGVILWTRVTPDVDGSLDVDWEIAEDTTFSFIVASGTFSTDSSRDYTVKIPVVGLSAESTYYYRFEALGKKSITGRTRTASTSSDHLKFAVVSCNSYQSGYFNAFGRIAERNDLDAVVHLGDFIYENEQSTSAWAVEEERGLEPDQEIIELNDYRLRYNWYRLDADLRRAMQQHPFIFVWDDHETANNSWTDGAENHNPADGEGDWEERKMKALQAYFEWIPIRDDPSFDIQRTIDYGNLAEFIMLDTRLAGREEQLTDAMDSAVWDPDRTILGTDQFEWFTDELKNSTAQWKVIGNQVVFAPLLLEPFEPVYPGAANEFLDVWNGYPAERNKVIDTLDAYDVDDVVFVTGDVHIAVALDVPRWSGGDSVDYDVATSEGSFAVEFVTTSITSDNYDERLGSEFISNLVEGLFTTVNLHGKYAEFDQHGYLVLDLTPERAQSDFFFVDDKLNRTLGEYFEEGWYSSTGDNHLQQASSMAPPKTEQETPAPDPTLSTFVGNIDGAQLWNIYPNPTQGEVQLAFSVLGSEELQIDLLDIQGRSLDILYSGKPGPGHYQISRRLPKLAAGNYLIRLQSGQFARTRSLIIH